MVLKLRKFFFERDIDFVLLDVKVPSLDGFDLLKKLRDSGDDTPAIFITSLNSVEDVTKGFDRGCDDYIRKPFALKELLVRIEAQLKKSFNTHDEFLGLKSGLRFDIKSQKLLKNNYPIPLKTKEIKLLSLLLKHPNELLTYEKIYEVLWDFSEEPSSGSLRAYIKTLRSHLGKESIETVKNRGYRFVG